LHISADLTRERPKIIVSIREDHPGIHNSGRLLVTNDTGACMGVTSDHAILGEEVDKKLIEKEIHFTG
jgi:hypothetical protein